MVRELVPTAVIVLAFLLMFHNLVTRISPDPPGLELLQDAADSG